MLRYGVQPAPQGLEHTMLAWTREVIPAKADHRRAKAVQQARPCTDECNIQPVLVTRTDVTGCLDQIETNAASQSKRKCLCRAAHPPDQHHDSQWLDCLLDQRSDKCHDDKNDVIYSRVLAVRDSGLVNA